MDFIREQNKQPFPKKYQYAIVVLLILLAAYFLKSKLGNASFIIDKNELVTAQVEQGAFRVNVNASGVLKPLKIRWISSQVSGRVEQVYVKPGAEVEQGQLLVELSNPELHRELEQARWELEAYKAESHASYVSLESTLVDLENTVIAAEYSYQSAKLKLDAETSLIEQGNGTVSALDYQKSQLMVKQQLQHWRAQQQKVIKLKASMQATKTAQLARMGLVKNNYDRVKAQVNSLGVKAVSSGVVQQVSLELGQLAQIGDSVALIADQTSLYAELNVQEVRARDIIVGQQVVVDTRTSEIVGAVTRIDPAVNDGMVLIDVELSSALPQEARPELTVEGLIEISNIQNTLFVKRPVFAPKNTNVGLYRLSKDKQFAAMQRVDLGQSSVNQIQVLSGLNVGDEIIISDTASWQEHQEIMIN